MPRPYRRFSAPQRLEDVFAFAEPVQHNNHMSLLPRKLEDFNIFKKSTPAVLKTAFRAPNVPVIQEPVLFRLIISLDSPLLIKKDVFPELAAAQSKKVESHRLRLLNQFFCVTPVSFGIAVIVTSDSSLPSRSIRI